MKLVTHHEAQKGRSQMQEAASCCSHLQFLPPKEPKLLPWLGHRLRHPWRDNAWVWGFGGALPTVIRANRL